MGLALLRLRDADLEYAVGEVRLDALRVDPAGKREAAREPSETPLGAMEARSVLTALVLPLAGDGEGSVLHLDRDVLLPHAREVGGQGDRLLRLAEVHGGLPASRAVAVARGSEERVEEPVHVLLEGIGLEGRVPTNESGHLILLGSEGVDN